MRFKYVLYAVLYVLILFLLYGTASTTEDQLVIQNDVGSIVAYTCYEYNCADILILLMNEHDDVRCAFYDIDEPPVVSALATRNISTLIFDKNFDEHENRSTYFTSVTSRGLMHHKFCIYNNHTVVSGSWNPTARGTHKNDNVVFVIQSKVIAESFAEAYNNLLDRSIIPEPILVNLSSGGLLELRFCPYHNCEDRMIEVLREANESIRMMSFTFTSQPVAEELINLSHEKNVSVEVLFEKTRITRYSAQHRLSTNNVTVYNDTNGFTMHHKTIIIDNETIITGSYNPTAAANTKNDENMIIIRGNADVVRVLDEEWSRLVK